MAVTTSGIVLFFLTCLVFPTEGDASLAPALYVFGDSLIDAGNNNYLHTKARGNTYPNGIDFPGRVSTGRVTNGFTVADFLAQWMELPLVPPVLGCLENYENCRANLTGYNFGSGSSGILPETGSAQGEHLDLSKQVELFAIAVAKFLTPGLKSPPMLSLHLAKSIFFFCTGSNDYSLTFLMMNETRPEPQAFAKLLLDSLGKHLEVIYKLGARKFLVSGLPPISCPPGVDCTVVDLNTLANVYNTNLEMKISQLTCALPNSSFVLAHTFKLVNTIINHPSRYGFKDVTNSCVKDGISCSNRDEYFSWDGVHPTQEADKIIALNIFNGTDFTTPMNVVELITV